MDEVIFSVEQVNRAIGGALSAAFPDPFWVVGEVQGFDRDASKADQRRWGQVYFELIEKEAASDAAKASVKALMWGDARRKILQRLAALPAEVRLQDGLKVKVLCAVDFYWPRASLQLKVLDVDPEFTLGDLERARRELVEALKREGLFDANRAVRLPVVPLGVGLITSEGSAAFHDFMQELRGSGYGFSVTLADARMQGEETEASAVSALRRLEADSSVDVIALVRGGGSRSDLLWFDREKIARAVAACAKPVVTGIGHEIDLSVADLVAHQSLKTPTAAAGFIVGKVREFEQGVAAAAEGLLRAVRDSLESAGRDLEAAARAWRPLVQSRVERAAGALAQGRAALASGVRAHLSLHRERLSSAPVHLGRSSRDLLARAGSTLESFKKECAWKDPRRLLARGYSLAFAGERLVKSVAAVSAGTPLTVQFSDGRLETRVERTVP